MHNLSCFGVFITNAMDSPITCIKPYDLIPKLHDKITSIPSNKFHLSFIAD